MSTTCNASRLYEYQPPTNINAIRNNIMQRIKQRNEHIKHELPPTPPNSSKGDMEKKLPYLHLDNGLPSPPIESCNFEEDELPHHQQPSLDLSSPAATLPDSPPSPVMSTSKSCTNFESSEAIREKIRLLKEEKHRLFQTMKDLLSQPKTNAASASAAAAAAAASAASTTVSPLPSYPLPPPHLQQQQQQQQSSEQGIPIAKTIDVPAKRSGVERSRSQSRDKSLKSRPIIRSRSISHSEFSRPISRYSYYHERRSPPRFYNNEGRTGYSYSRSSYPSAQQTANSSLSCSSTNMPRRALHNINNNNNNNSSSYVSSRSQLAAPTPLASSSASLASRPCSSFRLSNRPMMERHSRDL